MDAMVCEFYGLMADVLHIALLSTCKHFLNPRPLCRVIGGSFTGVGVGQQAFAGDAAAAVARLARHHRRNGLCAWMRCASLPRMRLLCGVRTTYCPGYQQRQSFLSESLDLHMSTATIAQIEAEAGKFGSKSATGSDTPE